jgi:hypothetical protein
MFSLRARRLALAIFSMAATLSTAQTLSTSPGPHGLGSGLSWSLRSDYTPGLKWHAPEPHAELGTLADPHRTSLYADWFPFTGHGFRVVGGLTLNDTWSNPLGGAHAVSGAYQLRPRTTTYLGIGYGSHGVSGKGLGFYADMGVSLGAASDNDSGLNGMSATGFEGWRTQQNGWLGFRYLPSVSLGLIYRY